MATVAPAQQSPFSSASSRRSRPGRFALQIILALVLVIVLAFGGLYGWIYYRLQRALPQVDGAISISGLSAPVTVTRDVHGVPHIKAANIDDVVFAQGYVTAQDRLWQMDATRRFAGGELAEILGVSMVKHDTEQRYLQLRHSAEAAAAVISPEERHLIERYAAGVNAFIKTHRDRLPFEFTVLRYQPREWTVADSLLMGANMSQMLNSRWETELLREKVTAKLTPDEVKDLYPNSSWRDHPPGQDSAADIPEKKAKHNDDDDDDDDDGRHVALLNLLGNHAAADCEMCVPGSNNWVVSGEHTASGKPLLSNDMHLAHTIPSIWYEAHLTAGDLDVAGVTLPGIPMVISGHNQRIAWGFTNLGPDVQDLFIEQFNAAGEVATPNGYQKPEHRREVIHVKNRPDVVLDVVVTRHGPVISPMIPGEQRQIALQWTIYDPAIMTLPFLDIDKAEDWQQFRSAFSHFGGPSQNVVYADVDGHIGYQATGKIPQRVTNDDVVPQSGADGAHDWTGYIPFDQLPSVFDPASGVIATANGRTAPDDYPHLLSSEWFSPYRTERIYRLLESKDKLTPQDMLAFQTDITSEIDRYFADRFVYAIDHSASASARVKQAAEVMRGWDGRMSKDSSAATVASFSRRNFARLLLEPKLGSDVENYSWGMSTVAMETMITKRPAHWLPKQYATWDDLLVAAVAKTVSSPDAPKDLSTWRWGPQLRMNLQHPVFSQIPLLSSLSSTGPHEQSGGGATVKQIGRAFGPSERLTVDFSDLDNSTLNIVVGESGDPVSPHYKDQFDAWYSDRTFILPFSPDAIAKAKEHELTLTPAR